MSRRGSREAPGLMDEGSAEKLFRTNPWLVNLQVEYPNDKYPHRAHKKVFTKEELEGLFPSSQVMFIQAVDSPVPSFVVFNFPLS